MPVRADIMAHVITSLEAIAIADDYYHDAETVARTLLSPEEISAVETPWFGAIATGVERVEHQPCGVLACTLPIVVAGALAIEAVGDQTPGNRADACTELLDDIQYALCGTVDLSRRGGLAISTSIVEQWTDESFEIPEVLEHGNVIAYVVVRAQIRYDRQRGHT